MVPVGGWSGVPRHRRCLHRRCWLFGVELVDLDLVLLKRHLKKEIWLKRVELNLMRAFHGGACGECCGDWQVCEPVDTAGSTHPLVHHVVDE